MTWQMWLVIGLFFWVFIALNWKIADPIIVGDFDSYNTCADRDFESGNGFFGFFQFNLYVLYEYVCHWTGHYETGLADTIGSTIINLIGRTERRLTLSVAVVSASMSAFLNDTGTTGCLMPIVGAMAQKAHVKLSRIYMTLAFFASMGGTITLVGTTPHIIASGLLEKAGYQGYGFFEFTKVGLPITIIGGLYMYFIGSKMLPEVETSYDDVPPVAKKDKRGMVITSLVFIILVVAMATKIMPFHLAAVLGSIIVVVTKRITVDDAISSFSMPTLFLVAGVFPLSGAMAKTGVTQMLIGFLGQYTSSVSPYVGILLISGLTAFLTQFMMGNVLVRYYAALGHCVRPIPELGSSGCGYGHCRGIFLGVLHTFWHWAQPAGVETRRL